MDTKKYVGLVFGIFVKAINMPPWVTQAATRLMSAALLCFLTGCLSRPPLHTQTFAFDPPAGAALDKRVVQHQRVVSIRSIRVAAPFDDRPFVYRTGEFSYVADSYAEFLDAPGESLRAPIRSWMHQSDSFKTVVEPGSALKPNTMAEITVLELYGDFRRPSEAAAVLTIRFVLLESPEGIPGKLLFEGEYSRRVLLKEKGPHALMVGWNEALNQVLGQLGSDLRGLASAPHP